MQWDALDKDFTLDNQYMKRLIELSCVMFEWKNLPDDVDPRFIEMSLFFEGRVLFFRDEALKQYVCLPFNYGGGNFDPYGNPTEMIAYSRFNSYQYRGNNKNSVPIYNNTTRTPSVMDIKGVAHRLSQLDQTIDVNCNAQKTPVLILCDREQGLSMLNL